VGNNRADLLPAHGEREDLRVASPEDQVVALGVDRLVHARDEPVEIPLRRRNDMQVGRGARAGRQPATAFGPHADGPARAGQRAARRQGLAAGTVLEGERLHDRDPGARAII